jgi:hypothetical protein
MTRDIALLIAAFMFFCLCLFDFREARSEQTESVVSATVESPTNPEDCPEQGGIYRC